MPLDLDKPLIRKIDSKPARLLTRDLKSKYPYVVAVTKVDGEEQVNSYDLDKLESQFINAPEKYKREFWAVFYKNSSLVDCFPFDPSLKLGGIRVLCVKHYVVDLIIDATNN